MQLVIWFEMQLIIWFEMQLKIEIILFGKAWNVPLGFSSNCEYYVPGIYLLYQLYISGFIIIWFNIDFSYVLI
jgi:hypothetical protein